MLEFDVSNLLTPENWACRTYKNVNSAWEGLYVGLCADGEETSPRGLRIRETLGANVLILNPKDNLVYNKFRGLSPIYLAKEYMWYNDNPTLEAEDAGKLSKFWLTLADENGKINSNYGYHIFSDDKESSPHWNLPQSQWANTRDILSKDPDSRKAIIQLPIIGTRFSKDTICTSSIQFFIRHGKLNMIVYMRSNDVVLGFPIDAFQFTMWQIKMAQELGVEVGWYQHIAGSLHVYEKHFMENVNDKFEYSTFESKSNPGSSLFMDDIKTLSSGKCSDEMLNDETFKYMLNNKKIWK